jgi:glycine betaine/proline transport system substrate-binding protein
MMQYNWRFGIVAGVFAVAMAFSETSGAQAPETNEPIKLTLLDYTGQYLSTKIMGGILQRMGYQVEYVQAETTAMYTGLKTGDLDVEMETWETTQKELVEEAVGTGKVLDMGETGMQGIEDWWYPSYMKEKCPGLPDWHTLADKACAEAFSTAETAPKGRYVAGPTAWGGYDEERVQALGLDFEVVHAGSDAALFAELESAYQRKAPIMLWVYAPHWAPSKYDGEWVKFPEYTEACYNDPSWGVNPNMKYDCGKPHGWIKKIAWAGGEQKWPAAYEAIRRYHMDNKTMGDMIGQVDLEGKSVDEVAEAWIEANESVWKEWTK